MAGGILGARLQHEGAGDAPRARVRLDRPTSGHTFVGGLDIGTLDDAGLTRLRRDRIGFVFQSFNLVPTLNAAENITLPAALAGRKVDQEWLGCLVDQLGIGDRLTHRPNQLSGGQQQRVACARALINKPDLIFADEPTGNLDSNASADLLAFLHRSVTELGQSIVMVTPPSPRRSTEGCSPPERRNNPGEQLVNKSYPLRPLVMSTTTPVSGVPVSLRLRRARLAIFLPGRFVVPGPYMYRPPLTG